MNARDIMALARGGHGFTTLDGYKQMGGMSPERFRDAASTVTRDDLSKIGIGGTANHPSDLTEAVDPAAAKFDAMMALKKAKASGMPTRLAEERMQDAEMMQAGVDEVLRRRQKDFNEAARTAEQPVWNPLVGTATDPRIAGLTGAAYASQARAGRPQTSLPQEDRAMSVGEQFAAHPSYMSMGTPGAGLGMRQDDKPFSLSYADVNGPRAGLGRARSSY